MERKLILASSLLALACGGVAVPAPDSPPGAEPSEPGSADTGALPAFVVHDSSRTILVPHEGEPVIADGLWVIEADCIVQLQWLVEHLDRIECSDPGQGCLLEPLSRRRVVIDPDTGDVLESSYPDRPDDCACWTTEEAHESTDDSEDADDPCAFMEQQQPSVWAAELFAGHGGTLHWFTILDNDGCSGVHIIDLLDQETALYSIGERQQLRFDDERCLDGLVHEQGWPPSGIDEDACLLERPAHDAAAAVWEQDCAGMCEHADGDAMISWLGNGRYFVAEMTQFNHGDAYTVLRSAAVSPDHCPTETDPCGDPTGFDGLADHPYWWVATDGTAALVLGGTLSLLRPGSSPRTIEDFSIADLWGVRWYADARALARAMSAAPPPGGHHSP